MSPFRTNRVYPHCLFFLCCLLQLAPGLFRGLQAQSQLPLQELVVFKNGIGFYQHGGKLPLTDGELVLDSLPMAGMGSLWLETPGNRITGTVAGPDTVQLKRGPRNLAQFLQASVGKEVSLNVLQGEDPEEITGTVQRLGDGWLQLRITLDNGAPRFMMLRLQDILAAGSTSPALPQYEKDTVRWRARIQLKESRTEQALNLRYLGRGVSWVPAYRIVTGETGQARVELRATVMNENARLEDTRLRLTVGVPSFKGIGVADPLASFTSFRQLMNQYGGGYSPGTFSNVAITSQSIVSMDEISAEGYLPQEPEMPATQSAEDYIFFDIGRVNLPRGSVAYYDLLNEEVPYQEIYTGNLPSYNTEIGQKISLEHYLLLENTTGTAWTTGTAHIVYQSGAELLPVSQGELNFTPPGGTSRLRVTESPQVRAQQSVKKIEEREKVRRGDEKYIERTYRATVVLENFRDKDVSIRLNRRLSGVFEGSSEDFEEKAYSSNSGTNPTTEISWEVDVPAGEKLTLTYTWKYYYNQ